MTQPVTTPPETTPAETTPAETKPPETRPRETRPRGTRPRKKPRRQQKQPCYAPDRCSSERPPEASTKGGGVWQPGPGQLRTCRAPEEQVEKQGLNSLLLRSFWALPAMELLYGETGPQSVEDEELDEEDEEELDGLEDEEKEDALGDEFAEEDVSIVPPSSVSTT
ncbi:unnamed protein product [Boreogadus saida]